MIVGKKHSGRSQTDRAREVGLFRYALIRQAADPALTGAERGQLVRGLAEVEHAGPDGDRVRVSRVTLDRWIRTWRAGGFDALVPSGRGAVPRTDAQVLELAVALKRENPARTAAQVAVILAAAGTKAPSARTLQRHFARLELTTRPDGTAPKAFGRFEAERPNERWTGDALHGPKIAGRKVYLFAFLDDHSRTLVGYRWGHGEDTLRLSEALRAGLVTRGIPATAYVDNGSAFVSAPFLRALAVLGIRLVHSRPGQPAGRGKIERFFRTVREQFLVELATEAGSAAVGDLDALNIAFTAWVETVYHHRVHSETGQAPLARFLAEGPPKVPDQALLTEAFRWSAMRTVTKTATISLHGNVYQVDAALVGRKIEVVFDPMDLTVLAVRYQGRDMGTAVPHKIGRHVHPSVETPAPEPAAATGIDYLHLITEDHQQRVREDVGSIDYNALAEQPPTSGDDGSSGGGEPPIPGQLELPGTTDIGQDIAAAGGAL
jgi:putative transposase